ncbi:MAG: bifunctional pyr operon transcriptional regulator/uracil phosphoribosyltransferase PyrR [Undibacterium sp.]|uniref:bifunctional pyr operon transcriptional regulator/uracil phosphoribosyltransferase PyrR n=1 Tax=Undibacterium sp. TaxID=1914977 RepID=UPI0027262386|nr:bifunctional pyr operon transcriptional regulator/uracil phosphoribosyltransferase PyrR [Undibacterium sp.]MDO8652881.1 bifunctional pyr operon transcriptional regulator/uracil phosphoribosyltransferase PyrR [Undibacterium sp.]
MNSITSFLDAEALYLQLLTQIKAQTAAIENLAVVGIYSGGAWLAQRLATDLGLEHKAGFIDVSFYRDDYAKIGLHADVKPTQIPFEVDNANIILVDDVLYTGRTTRAAINELFDYGRPARIMLAALVDRGGRELPIAADFVAYSANFDKTSSVHLQRATDGKLSLSINHA